MEDKYEIIIQNYKEPNPKEIGFRIKRLRQEQGLTQRQLGERLGIDEEAVKKIENEGRGLNKEDKVQWIANVGFNTKAIFLKYDNVIIKPVINRERKGE